MKRASALMRILMVLVIISMIVLSFAACSKPSDNQKTSDVSNNEGTSNDSSADKDKDSDSSEDQIKKPTQIKFMVDGTFLLPDNGQEYLVKAYEEKTGIKLIVNQPAHNEYYEKVNLAFATGDIPDVLLLSGTHYLNYAMEGALYDITELYENSELKNRIVDQAIIDAVRVNGRLYGLPRERGNGTITYVRGDWLKKLGIDIPKNYEEFINMLRRFANEDPDGNGVKDTIPLTAAGLVNSEYPMDIYLREFYQNASPDFVQKDGKWVDGMTEPEMRDALQRMKDAYAEGLIDKEIVTNKTSTCRDKFYSGKVGVFNYWAGQWNENLLVNIRANVPEAEVTPIPAIEETYYIERPAVPLCITSKAENPEGIFKYFFEYMLDSGEGQTLFTHGVEGIMYEMKDGKMVKLPSLQNPDVLYNKTFISGELSITDYKDPYEYSEPIVNSLKMFREDAVQYNLFPSSEVLNKLVPELNAIKSEIIAKVVVGDYSVDQGLEEYKNRSKDYVEQILADLNK
jgi:putative aldouronate transport system substrate-binding protein